MRLDHAKRFFLTGSLATALLVTTGQVSRAEQAPTTDARAVLERLIPSVAVRSHDVHVVPLIDRGADQATQRIVPAQRASHLVFKATPRRGVVLAANGGMQPVFLAAGSILSIDGEEHVIRKNHVLTPKSKTEVDALVLRRNASSDGANATGLLAAMAPRYLRERLDRGVESRAVRSFLRRFEPALVASDVADGVRPSFDALDSALAGTPDALPASLQDSRAVGFATVLNGRVHSVEVFASHELMAAFAPSLLRAHAYKARALASHGDALGVLRPLDDDPIRAAREATALVRSFLADMNKNARYRSDDASEAGANSWAIRGWKGVRGQIDAHGSQLVHAVLYPRAPYQKALYSRTIRPDEPATNGQPGLEELGRREGRGTTTEAEDRRLKRAANRQP